MAFAAAADRWFDRGDGGTDLAPAAGIAVIVLALWPCAYFARRDTLGKRLLGLYVEGRPPRAWLRGSWGVVPLAAFAWPWLGVVFAADVLWPFFDSRHALHDRLARTEVLRPVREPLVIGRLREVGADGRRAFAEAALVWAHGRELMLDHTEVRQRLEEARRRIAEAPSDPYAAWNAWSHAHAAVTAPYLDRLTMEQIEDEEFFDVVLMRIYDESEEAESRALAEVEARYHA